MICTHTQASGLPEAVTSAFPPPCGDSAAQTPFILSCCFPSVQLTRVPQGMEMPHSLLHVLAQKCHVTSTGASNRTPPKWGTMQHTEEHAQEGAQSQLGGKTQHLYQATNSRKRTGSKFGSSLWNTDVFDLSCVW